MKKTIIRRRGQYLVRPGLIPSVEKERVEESGRRTEGGRIIFRWLAPSVSGGGGAPPTTTTKRAMEEEESILVLCAVESS